MADYGSLSTLGLGSSGALNYDIIDKLRQVDEDAQIKPLDSQLEDMQNKQTELAKITTMTASLKSSLFELSDSVLFAKRSVEVTGSDIEAFVEDGTKAQQIDISVKSLAREDIKQTKGFAADTSVVTTVDTDMAIDIGGESTTFTVAAGTTLAELKDLINEQMGGSVEATILNTGGTDPYRLVLKSTQTGADQAMSFSFDDGDPNTANDDFLDLTLASANVQDAADALFTYNGIDITRSSNTIDDLVVGMTLTLKGESGAANRIDITQDNEAIADKVEEFVNQYNELMSELSAVTKYDPESKTAGIFQGDSTIVSLKLTISQLSMGLAPNGHGLADFGIEVNRDGVMSLDRDRLISSIENDQELVSNTFAGTDSEPGIFASLKDYLSTAATDSDSMLSGLDESLREREKALELRRERTLASLDNKYEIMAQKFAAYDAMIGKLNASFQSLQSMIDAQANSSN
ncbi:MAG: flagellar filament capping protein FliD [Hydrogenimonas sp.]|nr:flagellar filament capping protein FliD [Hydrogenimonas sp.]